MIPALRPRLLGPLALCCLLFLGGAATAEEPGAVRKGDPKERADLEKRKAALVLRAKVNRAIQNGAHWVAQMQRNDGSFALPKNVGEGPFPESRHRVGITALCTYTLADCGYGPEREEIRKALAYLRKHYRSLMGKGDYWPQASSYSLSLLVLGLHTLFAKEGTREQLDQRDRYGKRKLDVKNSCGYPKWAERMIRSILDWLMSHQAETGLFRYPEGLSGGPRKETLPTAMQNHMGPEDLSNTQYVLLALWAGSRCGYDVPVAVLEKIGDRLLAYQEASGPKVKRERDPQPSARDGGGGGKGGKNGRYAEPDGPSGGSDKIEETDQARGFPYTIGRESTGSMTTAGLSSLAIVKAMLMEKNGLTPAMRRKLDRGIWDGIAWLTYHFTLTSNPGGPGQMWHYYYLYGLERACVIAGKRLLGKRDWYVEGARLLVEARLDDGRWRPGGQLGPFGTGPNGPSMFQTDLLDTCFALLFLKRTTIVPKRPILPPAVTTGGK